MSSSSFEHRAAAETSRARRRSSFGALKNLRATRIAVLFVIACALGSKSALAATVAPPTVRFKSGAATRRAYKEGDGWMTISSTTSVTEGYPASSIVRADAKIVNVQDAGEEELQVEVKLEDEDRTAWTYDVTTATLTVTSINYPTDETTSKSTASIENALQKLKFRHMGTNIGLAPRGLTLTLTDEAGRTSAPALATISISRDNVPPVLDLNGPRNGTTYEVTMSANERMIGVRLSDINYECTDSDDVVLQGCTVVIDSILDGDVEYISADTSGTSISQSWNSTTRAFELTSYDSVKNYCNVLGTIRYYNNGTEQSVNTSQTYSDGKSVPSSTKLKFTAGVRSFNFELFDSSGNSASAIAKVDVKEFDRTGDALYDDMIEDPIFCNNQGNRTSDSAVCICVHGYTGDSCEIHECSNHGSRPISDQSCECDSGFSGDDCSVECQGHGNYNATSGKCACDVGYAGRDCSVTCSFCAAETGECTLTAASEASWDNGTRVYKETETQCECLSGWSGESCTDACPCRTSPFDTEQHGNCSTDASGEGYCACHPGYTGADCTLPCTRDCGDALYGECYAPEEYEAGIYEQLVAIKGDQTITNKTEAVQNLTQGISTLCRCIPEEDGTLKFTGENCNLPCPKSCEYGACSASATCDCFPGYVGLDCTQPCSGNSASGDVSYLPVYQLSAVTDRFPNSSTTGLFNTTELYGYKSADGLEIAYCECKAGFTGDFCNVTCDPCSFFGTCLFNGTHGLCDCDSGQTGSDCSILCQTCQNGKCGSLGECVCDPGYGGSDCSVECGNPTSRGTINPNGAVLGYGLLGSTVTCDCNPGYTGPMCLDPCPYTYDANNGVCVIKDTSDILREPSSGYTEIVCKEGWSGMESLRRGRDCKTQCDACDHGMCQDDGECICDYGYIWQPATRNSAEGGQRIAVTPYPWWTGGSNPTLEAENVGGNASQFYNATYHSCSVRHPCSMNGEYLNATCASGYSMVAGTGQVRQIADIVGNGGWGCSGTIQADGSCEGGEFLLAMPYVTKRIDGTILRDSDAMESFSNWGIIAGAVCVPGNNTDPDGMPIAGGYCLCDALSVGRTKFPSSQSIDAYDDYWQGWAGTTCDIPCAPCSENGVCNSTTGACDCKDGWTGYRCLTPCQDCIHGTCQYDGSCLCDGVRRLRDGSFALRLDRDPLFATSGIDEETSEYIHPYYMTATQVEDYIWGMEFKCANSSDSSRCSQRTKDSKLPFRPNETFFRYAASIPSDSTTESPEALQKKLEQYQRDIVTIPESMRYDEICTKLDYKFESTTGECMAALASTASCGSDWDTANPWDCDDPLKAHFFQTRKEMIGATRMDLKVSTEASDNERWYTNSVNERQRLLNVFLPGRYDPITGTYETTRSSADRKMLWIVNQLIHGVVSGPAGTAYTGETCSIPCDACDIEHGTCQLDGKCECEIGWYGDDCSKRCNCYKEYNADGSEAEIKYTAHGVAVRSWGVCQRDAICKCGLDDGGVQYTGDDCFTPCQPCHNGACQADSSCLCNKGWLGSACDIRNFTECLPCNYDHGTCLTDGTCKCDKGWTGLTCDLKCDSCVNGNCQLDGTCLCDVGWSLVDCSRPAPREFIAVSDFTDGPEGWTVYNNSCPGVLIENSIMTEFDPNAINSESLMRGACNGAFSGGDSGLLWQGVSGYMHLTDKLTGDSASELAYLRAPEKFTGDLLSQGAYNASITYSLFTVADSSGGFSSAGNKQSAIHQTSAYDIILMGGLPRYNREIPVWGSTIQIYNWTRTNFPELRINENLIRSQMIAIVEQYLNTPQVFLGYKVTTTDGYPPSSCSALKCSLNFAVDLIETGGWANIEPILSGFKWSNDVPVSYTDGTVFTNRSEGSPYDPFAGMTADTLNQSSINTDASERNDGGTVLQESNSREIMLDENGRAVLRELYPEVIETIWATRKSRTGNNVTFTEFAWCLASLKEILVRADYYVQEIVDASVTVIGESMRFDEFSVGKYVQVDTEAEQQIELFNYYRRYKDEYLVKYLEELYEDMRPSVCKGKWYLEGDPDPQLGDACKQDPMKLREKCEADNLFDTESNELGDYCVIKCPGYDAALQTTCSGFGTCGLNALNEPSCTCNDGYFANATGCFISTP